MYTPPHFKVEDPSEIQEFLREHSFGLLLSCSGDEIHETHTPFLVKRDGTLMGHIARANPHWKSWANDDRVKAVFSGPHTYISPRYYTSDFNVPTWNYTAVSVSGRISIVEAEADVLEFLDELSARNEPSEPPWQIDRNDERYRKLFSAIVVFSISPDKIDASFKLSQNKSDEDWQGVVDHLSRSSNSMDQQVAEWMKRTRRQQQKES